MAVCLGERMRERDRERTKRDLKNKKDKST